MSTNSEYSIRRHDFVLYDIVQVRLDGCPRHFHHGSVLVVILDVVWIVVSDFGIHDLFSIVFGVYGQGFLVASVHIEDGFLYELQALGLVREPFVRGIEVQNPWIPRCVRGDVHSRKGFKLLCSRDSHLHVREPVNETQRGAMPFV
jgi:hypothetical protein